MLFNAAHVSRLDRIKWLSRVSIRERVTAGGWPTEQLPDYSDSRALMQGWYIETNRALGDLQLYVFANAREHHENWNNYVEEANAVMRTNVRPYSTLALDAGSYEKLHRNLLIDDAKIALVEMELRGLGTPRFFENLLEVYEAGHLPCGWRGHAPPIVHGRREPAANYFANGTLLYW